MSDLIFPFLDEDIEDSNISLDLPVPYEYGWDFDKNDFIIQDGKAVIIEGIEAIKVWIYKALKTERDAFFIYSGDYGSEIKLLMQSNLNGELLQDEVKRILEECLLVNPYINAVRNIRINREKDYLNIICDVETDYGTIEGVTGNV